MLPAEGTRAAQSLISMGCFNGAAGCYPRKA